MISLGTDSLAGAFSDRKTAHDFVRHLKGEISLTLGSTTRGVSDQHEAHRAIEEMWRTDTGGSTE